MITTEEFVENIAAEEENGEYENFYKNEKQRYNLKVYLSEMAKLKPGVLLVGEAPGYLGCAKTGIPFTDERIIHEYNILPGKERYIADGCQKERTAKAMWDILNGVERLPLLWNAFPLHPYKKGKLKSNRKPNGKELDIGKKYICEIIKLFEIEKVYAVGVQAFNTLKNIKTDKFISERNKSYIRHPSYGGKEECREQIRKIFELYK